MEICMVFCFQLKLVDKKSDEEEYAKHALFSKHSEMKCKWQFCMPRKYFPCFCFPDISLFLTISDWPKGHNFQFFKLEIDNIFLIDWFGGPKPLSPDQYLHPKA